jgi:PKD repeat protein
VIPAEVETVAGVAVATFTAAGSPGQATIWATTGELTGTARIQVGASGLAQPVANFLASPLSGTAPLTVTFTDLSSGVPTSWAWDFGDGGSSTEQHPSHTYVQTGTFTVTLTVSNTVGSDTMVDENCVTVSEAGQDIYLPLIFKNQR